MTTQDRRERARAQRRRLIISTAKELAETEGWDAVTTRRLSQAIEYSQPVLYSHFAAMGELIDAVAVEGFAELATVLHAGRSNAVTSRQALTGLFRAYMDFADSQPAVFEAMFSRRSGLPFGEQAPPELRAGFEQFYEVLAPLAGNADPQTFVEVCWGALHGIVILGRDGRLRPGLAKHRLAILVEQLAD